MAPFPNVKRRGPSTAFTTASDTGLPCVPVPGLNPHVLWVVLLTSLHSGSQGPEKHLRLVSLSTRKATYTVTNAPQSLSHENGEAVPAARNWELVFGKADPLSAARVSCFRYSSGNGTVLTGCSCVMLSNGSRSQLQSATGRGSVMQRKGGAGESQGERHRAGQRRF